MPFEIKHDRKGRSRLRIGRPSSWAPLTLAILLACSIWGAYYLLTHVP